MTYDQVKDAEKTAQDMIYRNEKVYAKPAELALAKSVQGLRAVFEEVKFCSRYRCTCMRVWRPGPV